jgi:hypothetical protein
VDRDDVIHARLYVKVAILLYLTIGAFEFFLLLGYSDILRHTCEKLHSPIYAPHQLVLGSLFGRLLIIDIEKVRVIILSFFFAFCHHATLTFEPITADAMMTDATRAGTRKRKT